MAIEASGIYFRHVGVQSERSKEECMVCLEPLGSKAVAHFREKEPHVFHKGCLFRWLRNNESCPACLHEMTTPPPFSYYYLFPDFLISCPNTEVHRDAIAKKVAEIYSFFLTKLAHQGPIHQALLNLGVAVEGFSRGETGVPTKQIEIFAKYLSDQIKTHLVDPEKRKQICVKILYSPEPKDLLFEAFQRAKIDLYRYSYYLPRHTNLSIEATDERIQLMAFFNWCGNDEDPIEVELND